ncbi:uncharacterized protein LOC143693663 [Agelaius phoeniceus]|uniref:uncharacterized protein LOC143693663 n=1 Tax=Agelaius phoeniceus TaxID=39638 RepID=UPI0040552908
MTPPPPWILPAMGCKPQSDSHNLSVTAPGSVLCAPVPPSLAGVRHCLRSHCSAPKTACAAETRCARWHHCCRAAGNRPLEPRTCPEPRAAAVHRPGAAAPRAARIRSAGNCRAWSRSARVWTARISAARTRKNHGTHKPSHSGPDLSPAPGTYPHPSVTPHTFRGSPGVPLPLSGFNLPLLGTLVGMMLTKSYILNWVADPTLLPLCCPKSGEEVRGSSSPKSLRNPHVNYQLLCGVSGHSGRRIHVGTISLQLEGPPLFYHFTKEALQKTTAHAPARMND